MWRKRLGRREAAHPGADHYGIASTGLGHEVPLKTGGLGVWRTQYHCLPVRLLATRRGGKKAPISVGSMGRIDTGTAPPR
jgi:hypothetical protein